ncbi:inter-alpha-trypsin inhibitor heavy chain H3-like isoform X2 [Brachyhypopomus gauderio]|uniref:inter-alpha-trypsin inhibitor heavy chain H3-like isoform X2 n=1 Tax=Brachyhypopomus gauderio TaxID=698409 RepID=UPI0040413136
MAKVTVRLTLLGVLCICVISAPTKKERDVDIYSFHINSTVTSRYAITVITSRVANRLNESKEIHFEVKISKNAFISKFRMTIEGKSYDGIVKEKEEAQHQYSQAVSRGESAGIVSSVGRTLEEFKTSVTVAAFSKVTFELTYEELLKRRLGKYQLLINAQPMQPVSDFKIDVYIQESPGIAFLDVGGGLSTDELTKAITTSRSERKAWVNFYPTLEQQTQCKSCSQDGLNGDLLITYEIENGYFVHYFAPMNIQRIPKNVVFIIDRSGSMHGRKIHQTRLAMLKILGDLAGDDYFGLITFDSYIDVWKPELLQATESNLMTAKAFVKEIQDRGATDINAAVLKGVELINSHPREGTASILILLTDGDPTSGETNIEKIQANVKSAIKGKFPLYCLGFGFDVNFNFLEKMALENNGAARRIYEDSDADLQLQGFYVEVATPLLTHVQMNYTGVKNLTQASFSQYYNGSEIVVAGQITDNNLETFQAEVIAVSTGHSVTYKDPSAEALDPEKHSTVQRIWAYISVKQLLEKEVTLEGEAKEAAKKEALDLSLKYKFVTPLTSMVVTKPQEEETQVAHKPKEGKQHPSLDTPDRSFAAIPHHPGFSVAASHPGIRHQFFGWSSQPYPGHHGRPGDHGLPGPPGQPGPPGLPSLSRGGYNRFLSGRGSGSTLLSRADADLHGIHEMHDYRVPVRPTTRVYITATSPPVSGVRFIISAHGQPNPICYDIPAAQKLRLLQDSSSEFTMTGELVLYGGKGFKQITLHHEEKLLIISTHKINYSDGQNTKTFVWGQDSSNLQTNNVSLILRDNEMDVTMGTVRVIFLLHAKSGDAFLWPAVRQQPIGMQGILGKTEIQYEELPGSLVKIKDQEVKASWSTAVDYRLHSAPSIKCWLVPFQSAMQGELSDYTVLQL